MEFIQTLETNDLINLNLHILKQNKKIVINTIIISIIALIAGIYAIIINKIIIGIIFFLVMVLAIIGIPYIFKSLVKKQVTKSMKKRTNWDVLVKIDDEGIYYAFNDENPEKVDKYIWGDMYYAINTKGYIYIQISQLTYLIIKLSASSNPEELKNYFKKNLKEEIRYFEKK